MQAFVELRFRGLRLAEKARFEEAPGGGFVEHEAPLPVGTSIALGFPEGEKLARVTGVVEQEANAPSPPGMRVAWDAVPTPVVDKDVGDDGNDNDAPVEDEATQDATPGAKKRRGKKKPGR
jgi:hypothetical protein